MKVEYVKNHSGHWYWVINEANVMSWKTYTRERDAVRGFERFCAQVRAM